VLKHNRTPRHPGAGSLQDLILLGHQRRVQADPSLREEDGMPSGGNDCDERLENKRKLVVTIVPL
jgi:hypothetical protein